VPNRRIVRGGGERVHGLRLVTGSLRSVCVCWCVRELGEWRSGRWRQQRWHWRFLLDNPRLVRREHRQRRARSRDEVGLRRLRQPDRHARECGRRRVASTPRRSFCTVAPTALGCRRGSLPVHKGPTTVVPSSSVRTGRSRGGYLSGRRGGAPRQRLVSPDAVTARIRA
jgi:hypothetical protein